MVPLGLTAATPATDAAIQNKIFGSRRPSDLAPRKIALIVSSKEMEDMMKLVKSLEESGLLKKGVTETIRNETKKNGGFVLYY